MTIYYSKQTGGFYIEEIHGADIPADAVEISEAKHREMIDGQSSGKIIGADSKGNPVLQDAPEPESLTREQIEAMRLRAYADPLTGSDRFFSEAVRLQVMGADAAEIEKVKALGADRFAEIQSEYPWPQSEE